MPAALRYLVLFTPKASSSPSSSPSLSSRKLNLSSKPALLQCPQLQEIPLNFKEKVLCLELMGVDAGRALSVNPSLHSASLDSIHSIVSFLQRKGIQQKDMARIFGMCPRILTSDIQNDLNPVFEFLSDDLHVPDKSFRKVINKCPRLLVSSVRNQLKPALIYLQRLGINNNEALAYQDPVLLVSSVENTLIPKIRFLTSLGFCYEDVVGMVVRCPSLLTFSVENNFKPKFEYYLEEMKGSLEELKGFPQYFAFSLEKRIKPRHRQIQDAGTKLPISVMLKTSDQEFTELVNKAMAVATD
ncbi:transcription termination factor MTEF1, chloroplastic [Nymphaea colorata]|uniref:Uncharacterized protein n=1 Tax=Nymphaea colorata TaxID=210225 RepID=A0A5K0Z1Z1_9MAGN|nr:transcription termination factor MTEF1, chloroplastic [Nymphaea colorata]